MITFRVFSVVFCLGLFLALPAEPALAQRGGDDDRRGERDQDDDRRGRDRDDDRGGRDRDDDRRGRDRDDDRRGRDRDDDDDRRRSSDEDRRRWFISRLDRNGDGKIERSEVDSDRMWGYFERSAKEAGLDPAAGVTVDKYLRARQVQDRQELRSENPTAFLPPLKAEPAPGFDTPLSGTELIMLNPDKERPYTLPAINESTSSARSSRGSDRSSRESGDDRTERYAKSLMERYDKNGNSILERDEWKDMRGDPERSDLNKDGRITRDELIKRFSSFRRDSDDDKNDDKNDDEGDRSGRGRGGEGDRTERRERRSSDSKEAEKDAEARTTYRFTSALERLPRDARSWVEKYDKNKDGQVAMAEFTSSWTDSKVREFTGHDLNGDGVVTGSEYLVSKER
jgi:hypothetical protein